MFKGTGVEEQAISLAKFITAPERQWAAQMAQGLTPLRPLEPQTSELVASKPYWQPFLDGIEFGGPELLLTDYIGLQNVMIEMVQSVVTGAAELAAALEKARRSRAVQVTPPGRRDLAAAASRAARRPHGVPD